MLNENVNDNAEETPDNRSGDDRRQDERRQREDENFGEGRRSDEERRSWVGRRQTAGWRRQ